MHGSVSHHSHDLMRGKGQGHVRDLMRGKGQGHVTFMFGNSLTFNNQQCQSCSELVCYYWFFLHK